MIFTLIPLKKLFEAKMRLSTVLESKERRDFSLVMLKDVLRAIFSSSVNRTIVIGADACVQTLSLNYGATFLPDTGEDLNHVLEYATRWSVHEGAQAVLIIPADIPLLQSRDVEKIISLSSEEPSVVISPSHDGGTNALMRRPANFMKTHFGSGSFKKHIYEASKKGG